MGITENAAYLKGLAEGLKLDEGTNEGKLIVKMLPEGYGEHLCNL